MELAPLEVARLGQRRVADDLSDAAAQLRARNWRSLNRSIRGFYPGTARSDCCFDWNAELVTNAGAAYASRRKQLRVGTWDLPTPHVPRPHGKRQRLGSGSVVAESPY